MVGKLIAQVIAAGIIVTAYGVYWIGLEAVQGTVVANAVRLASTGTTYSHCNQWLADGTASLIQRKPGVAEATVHVQAQESPDIAENVHSERVHWEVFGAGFELTSPSRLIMTVRAEESQEITKLANAESCGWVPVEHPAQGQACGSGTRLMMHQPLAPLQPCCSGPRWP